MMPTRMRQASRRKLLIGVLLALEANAHGPRACGIVASRERQSLCRENLAYASWGVK